MFRIRCPDYGVLLRQFFVLISTFFSSSVMFLSRSESLKWIKELFLSRGNPCSNSNNNTTTNITTRPPEGEVGALAVTTTTTTTARQQLSQNGNNSSENDNELAEVVVMVANDTKIDVSPPLPPPTAPAAINVKPNVATCTMDSNGNGNEGMLSGHAPIARVEDAEEEEEESPDCSNFNASHVEICCQIDEKCKKPTPNEVERHVEVGASAGTTATVQRSKSRVRSYLKKCKDRLTGQHHHASASAPAMTDDGAQNASNDAPLERQLSVDVEEQPTLECGNLAVMALGIVEEDDEGSYEDIDFGMSTSVQASAEGVKANEAAVGVVLESGDVECIEEAGETEVQCEVNSSVKEERLMQAIVAESSVAMLIDSYLADIYPVYHKSTRAILIRQARDLLVCSYHGSLQAFEEQFLRKFAVIAETLKERHAIGDNLLWTPGWPLATHAGEVILHLGALEDALLRPADIYLCVRTDDNTQKPQLYAVWRSTHNEPSSIQRHCVDYNDPKAYLSALTLEMLSDELPQLLQNLLVGVERTIARISLNELQMPNVGAEQQSQTASDESNNNSLTRTSIIGSPKCALRRSELITKNKMLNNKFMLRRLTNRQDSMNSTSSGNSCASSGSASSDELLFCHNNNNNNNGSAGVSGAPPQKSANGTQSTSTSPALPLFCLGNSFPHIDSDEENPDEKRNSLGDDQFEAEIMPPSSIHEIPEKLLTTGVYLPGTRNLAGDPIVTVDAESVLAAGLNCYEIATVLLYYNTLPESANLHANNVATQAQSTAATTLSSSPGTPNELSKPAQQTTQTFTILIAIEKASHMCVIDLICQSLKLLTKQIAYCEILAVCLEHGLLQLCRSNAATAATAATTTSNSKEQPQQQQQPKQQQHLVKFISVAEVTTSVAPSQIPHGKLQGLHHHDARKWREFFTQLEPFQRQCAAAGHRLVAAMSDIRSADLQGLPTRRQLYAQHRALSRALMDSELHNLRKHGATTLLRLQELAKSINSSQYSNQNNNNNNNNTSSKPLSIASSRATSNSCYYNFSDTSHMRHGSSAKVAAVTSADSAAMMGATATTTAINYNNIDVAIKLRKVTLLFNEVDRAAKRLEQLTEQRRERLRELTRQRALEDEINEVTSWITSDGNETLQRFASQTLDSERAIKEHEQEFEKYYFISMKHLAKGRDLYDAAAKVDVLQDSAKNLQTALDCFAEKLEKARERIEGAARLQHLLQQHSQDDLVQQEMQRLAELVGIPWLLEKYRQQLQPAEQTPEPTQQQHQHQQYHATDNVRVKPNSLNLNCSRISTKPPPAQLPLMTSTPAQKLSNRLSHRSSSGNGSFDGQTCHCWRESRNLDDMDELLDGDEDEEDGEEEQSKIADSGVGGCERCEGNSKLARMCSCQSLNEAGNMYDKCHNGDELDDECFERPSKRYLDIHSPMEANAHLQCHASNLELPKMEELSCLDPKTQKTLLLIMREMIGTERDYVRSLYYVIENYVDELLRDDIPQPLRGQRNVIFGNIEKIFEFHNSHFLSELERYECYPLKVGAAFLEMESKFYLYALYNKNKPKSDTLMSEYGTAFFKSKQLELNDKMDLASYLLKPVQRMGKYALLLQQLVKACSTVEGAAIQEIGADVEELQRAEEMVKFQLRHGNDLLAMDSLRDCDVNVKEQGRLLRQNEFLVWQGRGGKKSLRHIFLFEELVLFSKARRFPDHKNLDLYIYKNSIKTSDIGLTAHVGDSPTKFEIWFRKRKPEDTWTLQCMSEDVKNAWTEEVSKLLWQQAKRNREIRLAEMSSMGIGSKPCLDIRPSNNQINDRSITITQLGKAPKLRHSFAGLHTEQSKSARRPNSLISESSLSSGTSSSSLSTGSSSGHERSGGCLTRSSANNHGLELINETQALMLSHDGAGAATNQQSNNNNNTNTLSSTGSGSTSDNSRSGGRAGDGGVSGNLRNHKRSTTLVSQLSMESGILSDISVTPEQEQADISTSSWTMPLAASHNAATATTTTTTTTTTVVMRRHRICSKRESHKELSMEITGESLITSNPYVKNKEESINL